MDKLIGKNIKMVREASGYTQDEVAKVLGINRSAYSNYESGIREMPYDLIEKASLFFGCEPYLFFEESPDAKNEMLATAFRINGLSDSDNEQILRFKDLVRTYIKLDKLAQERHGI